MNEYMSGSRKYSLALLASASAGLLCWYGHISGAEWVTAQSIVLGLYKAANIVDKKLGGTG